MDTRALALLLLLALLAFSSCKKNKDGEVMPNYSMNGSNTFAAYVNGKLWLPRGRPSTFQSNFNVVYEPGYKGGTLSIVAYRLVRRDPVVYDYITIGMAQVDKEGIYNFENAELSGVSFYREYCEYDKSPEVFRSGTLEVTKLDLKNGIIAGKFGFTLAKVGCDTIRVTDGRFDAKL